MDVERYEKTLTKRLRELTGRMHGIEDRLDDRPDPDPEERSVEREDDEALQSLGTAALTETRAVEAALRRIGQGTFGVCTACDGPISIRRLDAVPHAARCRHCA